GRPLDHDLAHPGLLQPLVQELADLDVLEQQVAILPVRVPARIPGAVDPQAQADRVDLVTHQAASSRSSTTMRRRANGFWMRPTRPRARGRKRFITSDLPTLASRTTRRSTSRSWLFSAFAIADISTFLTSRATARRLKVSWLSASLALRPRISSATRLSLRGLARTSRAIAMACV